MSISDAESNVMQVLWQRSPLTAEDIHAALAGSQGWHESTVKTLLSRLVNKQVVAATRDGRRYLYAPLLTRDDWLHSESESVLDRLFGGRIAPMVTHFSQRRQLSKKDIAELKKLISELDDGQ